MMYRVWCFFVLMIFSVVAQAELRVAATTPNMGMLARTVGGEAVEVTVMAPPDRDVHYLDARPGMMAALRRADLVVSVGADLEVGWLPAALEGANNRDVRMGTRGYFEATRKIELIETGAAADRAGGDVHPAGNPHFYYDPVRTADVAMAMAERLGELDSERADYYVDNAARFRASVDERMADWQRRLQDAPGMVQFHKDANYLAARFDVPMLGDMEPLPGIPPTARHLRELVNELRERDGVITYLVYHPSGAAEFLSGELGWPKHQLPNNVSVDADAAAYFELIDRWVAALAGE